MQGSHHIQRSQRFLPGLFVLYLFSFTSARAQPIPGEYGDAPDGGLAYPSLGVLGSFPTCIDIADNYVAHGPFQLAWFGMNVDFEPDGNGGPCGFPPYEVDECWGPTDLDAGLQGATPFTIDPSTGQIVPCGPGPIHHIGDACELVSWGPAIDILVQNLSGMDCVINVLFDWNRDGRWNGLSTCSGAVAKEHAVENLPIPDGYVGTLAGLGAPPIQIGPDRGEFWVRFSICSFTEFVPHDWSGAKEFDFGESEDYLLSVGEDIVAGELGDAPEEVIAYPIDGILGHFPTCLSGPNGYVLHTGNVGAWFGPSVDLEGDGNATLCDFSLYDNDECDPSGGDAGLMLADAFTIEPSLNIAPCTDADTSPLGRPCERLVWGADIDMWIENNTHFTRWVNVVFDWDNSGRWGESVTCANGDTGNEHVLADFAVPGGYGGPLSALGAPSFQILRGAGWVWSRFTLSDMPVGVDGWDGQGTFGDGETEDYLFRIADETGADPVEPNPASGLILEPNFPNPFNPSTQIAFTLSRAGAVQVTIQDLGGRRVATLLDRELDSGRQALTWTGTDDAGIALGSGVYFVRVVSGGESRTAKLTMIK